MKYLPLIAAVFFATSAAAQDSAVTEAARTYVNSEVQQTLLDSMFSTEGVMAQMGLTPGSLPDEKLQNIATIISDELGTIRPIMETAMIEGIAETLTLEEIEALTEFYNSEVGASAMKKINPFMARTMQLLAPDLQRMQANVARRIQEEMSQ